MDALKKQLLDQTHDRFLKLALAHPSAMLEWTDDIAYPNITGYGTAKDERVTSLSEFKKLMRVAFEQSADLKTSFEEDAVIRKFSPDENMVIHGSDVHLHLSGEGFSQKLSMRLTYVMKWENNEWRLVHFHASLPDGDSSSADTFHVEQEKQRIAHLEQLVAEKTAELTAKNRDLRIEAALAEVRNCSLAMQTTQDINNVVAITDAKLKELGLNINGSISITLFEEGTKNFRNRMVMLEPKGEVREFYQQYYDSKVFRDFYEARSGGEFYINKFYDESDAKEHIGKMLVQPFFAEGEAETKEWLAAQKCYAYAAAFMKHTGLFIVYFEPLLLSGEQAELIKKFAVAFEQAYLRFLDLQSAEKRAKEARIEVALEKVRGRSIAMRKSSEIQEVVYTLADQLHNIDIEFDSATILILHNDHSEYWMANPQVKYSNRFIDRTNLDQPYSEISAAFFGNAKTETDFFRCFTKEEKNRHWNYLLQQEDFKKMPQERKDFILAGDVYNLLCTYKGNVSLALVRYFDKTYKEEELEILKRFNIVFAQAYTRFLDLQKAEQQARESQIETALERVRAATNAMKKTEDLLDVIEVVSAQLDWLGLEFTHTNFRINEGEKDWDLWSHFKWLGKPMRWQVKYTDHPFFNKSCNNPEETTVQTVFTLEEQRSVETYLFEQGAIPPPASEDDQAIMQKYFEESKGFAWSVYRIGKLSLAVANHQGKLYSDEQNNIIQRFARSFVQSYTRFLDLQKAEAQAREARIEAALERVRSHSIGLRKSNELEKVMSVIFEELTKLGLDVHESGIYLRKGDSREFSVWGKSATEDQFFNNYDFCFVDHPILNQVIGNLDKHKDYAEFIVEGDELISYCDLLFSLDQFKELSPEAKASYYTIGTIYVAHAYFQHGFLEISGACPFPEDTVEVIKKFSQVIDLAYTRFIDLQNAEAQAREAQIEAALERVRSRTMAMQKSEELPETSFLLFKQMQLLGETAVQNSIAIVNEQKGFVELSTTVQGHPEPRTLQVPIDDPHVMQKAVAAWKANKDSLKLEIRGQELKDYNALRNSFLDTKVSFPENNWIVNIVFFSKGWLSFSSDQEISHESFRLLERFTGVFDQTYTRFLDLQKAEAQAREAQIEASLERVRAKTMAMHKSEDIAETSLTMFDEFKKLSVETYRCGVGIMQKGNEVFELWTARQTNEEKADLIIGRLKMDIHPMFKGIRESWLNNEKTFFYLLKEDDLIAYYNALNQQPDYKVSYDLTHLPERVFHYEYFFNEGSIFIFTLNELPEEHTLILKRFSAVFGQTYRRFLDIQKAEAQAREAQVEAALERVRAKTMAMHKSSELASVVNVMFRELRSLHSAEALQSLSRGFIMTADETQQTFDLWVTEIDGSAIERRFDVAFDEPTTGKLAYEAWRNKQPIFINDLTGDTLNVWLQYLEAQGFKVAPGLWSGRRINNFIYYSKGFIGVTSAYPLADDTIRLLQRFAGAFELTYTRFVDLQLAEERAKLAIKDASLDRLRAEIASMREAADLERITPTVWKELNALNIPFIRCGVFIMDNAMQKIHLYLSTPEGRSIASFELSYTDEGNVAAILNNWRNHSRYVVKWLADDFRQIAVALLQQGLISNEAEYLNSLPASGIVLHFLPFRQGMLYVGNADTLPEPDIDTIASLAHAFETAYARYEDFVQLEKAKAETDKALKDLQSAQQQLIQAEKMASLGELTAGIAHEIQNPLNFVNNFSDMNLELSEELRTEIEKGNYEEAKAIAEDIFTNAEKISHHGKRADAIVKGMLQHSRAGRGVKEFTDINALCDEYLRLSYHGLRAKDKSFNAEMNTSFDPSLPKVEVIPQDVGRVLLNLFNNAFYAVNEKSKHAKNGSYRSLVTVKTIAADKSIEIIVQDNGIGISENILNKIYQPFFTTKPTGEGTGLGLSLSYDIITKGHGGEMKATSKENEGTTFSVIIPVSSSILPIP